MNAIRIDRRLDSQVLDLPELAPLVGKRVQIIVLEEEAVPTEPADGPKAGSGKGEVLWIAPDFDETPEEFKDHV